MIVKQLPKGIPQGYKPQRQNIEADPYVLVSEYTRRVAHELDDLHSEWIILRKNDELFGSDKSPYAADNLPVKHIDWLNDFENAPDRYLAAMERRQWLEGELGMMRRGLGMDSDRWTKRDFYHYQTLKSEYLYVSILQSRMKAMARVANAESTRESLQIIVKRLQEMQSDNPALAALLELDHAIKKWIAKLGYPELPDELHNALDLSSATMQSFAEASQTISIKAERLGNRFMREDAKAKGDSICSTSDTRRA